MEEVCGYGGRVTVVRFFRESLVRWFGQEGFFILDGFSFGDFCIWNRWQGKCYLSEDRKVFQVGSVVGGRNRDGVGGLFVQEFWRGSGRLQFWIFEVLMVLMGQEGRRGQRKDRCRYGCRSVCLFVGIDMWYFLILVCVFQELVCVLGIFMVIGWRREEKKEMRKFIEMRSSGIYIQRRLFYQK